MKISKVIVFLIITALLGGGLYLFQNDKNDKALAVHNKQKFEQITKAAQKSSSAGLHIMVSIINKYHKSKGQYPKKLMDLYPEFIPDESFISSINWTYKTENGTYLVEKQIEGKPKVSMGPDKKLKAGKERIATTKPSIKSKTSFVALSTKIKPDTKKDKNQITNRLSSNPINKSNKKISGKIKSNNKINVPKFQPEFTIIKKELNNDEKFLLSLDRYNFYIWRTNEGVIGFSDIQYPDVKNLTIYKDKSWVEYKKNHKFRR